LCRNRRQMMNSGQLHCIILMPRKNTCGDLGIPWDDVGYSLIVRQRHRCRLFSGIAAMTGHLIVTDEDATRVITLRRPEKKNAITQDMYRAMSDAIDKTQNNPDIRCIIITGGSG